MKIFKWFKRGGDVMGRKHKKSEISSDMIFTHN